MKSLRSSACLPIVGVLAMVLAAPVIGEVESGSDTLDAPVALVAPQIPEYETPPFLSARDLLPAELLSGPRFRVQESVPTDGFLTLFTIESDFGIFHAASSGMARTRIAEIDALAHDDVAWTAFSGGLGVTVLKSLAPAATLITVTSSASNWVWETPPGDLRVWNEGVLLGLGADQESVDRFLRHPWYTLTLRTRLTKALDRMRDVVDRHKTMLLTLSVTSFDQARFVVESLEMLSELHEQLAPISRIDVGATVVGWSGKRLIVPAPVDALSWSQDLNRFAERPDLEAAERTLYIRGGVTERAQTALGMLGWKLRSWVPAEHGG